MKIPKLAIFLFLVLGFTTPSFGQAAASPTTGSPLEVKNAVGTVLLAGMVGGVLGLSTLSFYDRPQDNIRNIYFGAGGGMILATIYMTLTVATNPLPANLKGPVGLVLPPLMPEIDFEKKVIGLSYTHNFH